MSCLWSCLWSTGWLLDDHCKTNPLTQNRIVVTIKTSVWNTKRAPCQKEKKSFEKFDVVGLPWEGASSMNCRPLLLITDDRPHQRLTCLVPWLPMIDLLVEALPRERQRLSSRVPMKLSRDPWRQSRATSRNLTFFKKGKNKNSVDGVCLRFTLLYSNHLTYSCHCWFWRSRFHKTNPWIRRLQYVEAMEQYQAMMRQRLLTDEEDSLESRILLVLNAWQVLCRYTSIWHRRAWKIVSQKRHENSSPSPRRIQKALVLQVDAAEQNVACQKGLYLTQQ